MNHQLLSGFQRKMFWLALGLAVALHITAAAFLIFLGGTLAKGQYRELAVMDFAYYDPDGGEPGGGDSVEPMPREEAAPTEESALLEPKSEPELKEAPDVITTTAKEAAPAPVPPPIKEKVKPKPKPKSKAIKTESQPAISADAASGAKPGGGHGSGQGGVGGGMGQGNPKVFATYTSKIRARLNRLKKYPSTAASQRLGGVATVNFTIDRKGLVTASRLVKSSGHKVLDQSLKTLLALSGHAQRDASDHSEPDRANPIQPAQVTGAEAQLYPTPLPSSIPSNSIATARRTSGARWA